jgi:hypothetical protein
VRKSGGTEAAVPEASRLIHDPRDSEFWDGSSLLVHAYTRTLALPEDAWDVYLIYGAGAEWGDGDPPAPAFWMHQLHAAAEPKLLAPWLDESKFAAALAAELARTPPAP